MLDPKNYIRVPIPSIFPILLLWIGCHCSLSGFSQAPKLSFKHLGYEQGLSNTSVECILQDHRGYMWFGTRDGLNRYDGHEIKIFRNVQTDSGSISDNYITFLYEDSTQRLWIGTLNGLNSYDPYSNRFTHYQHSDSDPESLAGNTITSISEDKKNRFWVCTSGGLSLLDKKSNHFTSFRPRLLCPGYGGTDRINTIHEDAEGRLWIATNTGLLLFDPGSQSFHKYAPNATLNDVLVKFILEEKGQLWLGTQKSGLLLLDIKTGNIVSFLHDEKNDSSLSSNMIESMLLDKEGHLWVGTINGGVNLFHPANHSFYHYREEAETTDGLSKMTAASIFEDKEDNLWIGTHRGGVNLASHYGQNFKLYRKKLTENSLSNNDVNGFCEDRTGNLWIVTDGSGLDYFNRKNNSFTNYRYDPYNNKSLGSNDLLQAREDSQGDLWIGTWGGGLNLMDHKNKRFTRYLNDPSDSNSISSNYVQSTLEDSRGILWVATYYGGLNQFDRKTGKFHHIPSDPSRPTSLFGNNIVSMNEDRNGNMWFGTDDGGLNRYDPATGNFYHYFNDTPKKGDLRVIFIDKKGRLWIGQEGLYLFDPVRNTFSLYTDKGGMATEFIKGITEDKADNFWISTSRGLIQFNPDTYSLKRYNANDGLQGLEFEANSYLRTRDGEMFFGGTNGVTAFYPENIKINQHIPPVYITELQIFNEKIIPGGPSNVLQNDISLTDEITLSHNQSSIAFNFAALNYTNSGNNQYAYKLEDFDKDWHYSGNENKANYTNLDPGEYVFRVRASNNDGIWNENGSSIRIIINPPFWKTSWFLFLISLIMVCSLYILYLNKRKQQFKKMEEKKREEILQLQLQFFTNISHELRTPLMLILGPSERLLQEDAPPAIRNHYQSIYRNANRLLSLINELMDYRKLQAGALKLQVVPGNLNIFLEEISGEYYDWAADKSIHFITQLDRELPDVWYDRQVLEKIVLNLLSNAFKYTTTGGTITIDVLDSIDNFKPSFNNEMILLNEYRAKKYVYIRITDNGIGISGESIGHIFERYFRVSEHHLGSGIGLAFVKSLTVLHKGDIYVYSERHKGTEIIVGIPMGEENYLPEEKWMQQRTESQLKLESLHNRYEGELPPPGEIQQAEPIRKLSHVKHILITDDNEELRNFIKDCLTPFYQVSEAVDGRMGLQMAREESPDLIISDVMMPVMNGNDFCKAIKQDIATSHIPFIMLTAKDAYPAKVEGVGAGADVYFSKPLEVELLLLTIRNIFDQRQKLREHYTKSHQIDAKELLHSSRDKEFMDQLLEIIDTQLMNPELDIEYLCRSVNMSRSKLYEKIKALTGLPTGDFIRTIRLKKAVDIMLHEDVSIMEIACRIGIQTQSYFTKAFKKQYGKTPTQFMQELVRK